MRKRVAIFGVTALLAVNGVLLLIQPGLALPPALGSYFFGAKLVRADVVVNQNGIRQYRLDQGRILRIQGSSLLLREADATVVTVPVAPDADVVLARRSAHDAGSAQAKAVGDHDSGRRRPASEVRVRRLG